MATAADRHIDEETTEKYAMGKLSARAAALIEEHLLICEPCRQAVAASDAYVAAIAAYRALTERTTYVMLQRNKRARLRRSERKPMRRAAR